MRRILKALVISALAALTILPIASTASAAQRDCSGSQWCRGNSSSGNSGSGYGRDRDRGWDHYRPRDLDRYERPRYDRDRYERPRYREDYERPRWDRDRRDNNRRNNIRRCGERGVWCRSGSNDNYYDNGSNNVDLGEIIHDARKGVRLVKEVMDLFPSQPRYQDPDRVLLGRVGDPMLENPVGQTVAIPGNCKMTRKGNDGNFYNCGGKEAFILHDGTVLAD